MTKSIEEQANEAWNKVLIEYKYKDEFTHTRHLYYTSGYQDGAKARDAQWSAVVNELIQALKWQRSYLHTYLIISPKITTTGITPEENIKSRIDQSLTKADQLLKEMGIK